MLSNFVSKIYMLKRSTAHYLHWSTVNLGVLYPSYSCTLYDPKFMYIYVLVLTHHTSHKSELTFTSICGMSGVTHRPSGVRVEIVGIQEGNRGRSCEQHNCCGSIIGLDIVLRLQKVRQILNGKRKRRTCFRISILLTVHIHQILIRCERWRNIDCCLLGYCLTVWIDVVILRPNGL